MNLAIDTNYSLLRFRGLTCHIFIATRSLSNARFYLDLPRPWSSFNRISSAEWILYLEADRTPLA